MKNVKADLLSFVELYNFVALHQQLNLRLRFKNLPSASFVPEAVLGAYTYFHAFI